MEESTSACAARRSIFFLMNVKGVPDAATAGFMVSGLEVGGLAGSLLAGRLADGMVNSAKDPIKEGSVGKRVQARAAPPLFVLRSRLPALSSSTARGWRQRHRERTRARWPVVFDG